MFSRRDQKTSRISSDCVLIEKYFGRLRSFNNNGGKRKWSEYKYGKIIQLGVSFISTHFTRNPSKAENKQHYTCILNH